jgi:hypothetical protein
VRIVDSKDLASLSTTSQRLGPIVLAVKIESEEFSGRIYSIRATSALRPLVNIAEFGDLIVQLWRVGVYSCSRSQIDSYVAFHIVK